MAKKSAWKTVIKVTLLQMVSAIFKFNEQLRELMTPKPEELLKEINPIRISAPTNVQQIAHVG